MGTSCLAFGKADDEDEIKKLNEDSGLFEKNSDDQRSESNTSSSTSTSNSNGQNTTLAASTKGDASSTIEDSENLLTDSERNLTESESASKTETPQNRLSAVLVEDLNGASEDLLAASGRGSGLDDDELHEDTDREDEIEEELLTTTLNASDKESELTTDEVLTSEVPSGDEVVVGSGIEDESSIAHLVSNLSTSVQA